MHCKTCIRTLDPEWQRCPWCGDNMAVSVEAVSYREYRADIRERVFELIVRQAMAGVPWREICAGPMRMNEIGVQN